MQVLTEGVRTVLVRSNTLHPLLALPLPALSLPSTCHTCPVHSKTHDSVVPLQQRLHSLSMHSSYTAFATPLWEFQ